MTLPVMPRLRCVQGAERHAALARDAGRFAIVSRRARARRHASAVVAIAFVMAPGPRATAAVTVPDGFVSETVVGALSQPNAMAFLPDGRLLVTEQLTARVRLVVSGHVASSDPVLVVDNVSAAGTERGLQGIAVDPRWPEMPYVYVCYTRLGLREVIARYTAAGDLSDPGGEALTLSDPLELIPNIRDRASNHNGGGLRFGLDGMLYVGLGEDSDPCSAQHLDSLRGALLRLDVTGLPSTGGVAVPRSVLAPADNPFAAAADSNARLVYAYGLRNPWRFHIDPATGAIVLADVGESVAEEVDAIVPGGNYGWPFREGDSVHTVAGCTEPPATIFEAPRRSLPHDAQPFLAVLTAGFYRPVAGAASNWPAEYWGDAFYGDYFDSRLRRLRPSAGWTEVAPVPGQPNAADWAAGLVNVVDFAVGPDGSLWWLQAMNEAGESGSGAVHRIRHTGGPVSVPAPPSAAGAPIAMPNPSRGTVRLSGLGSDGRVSASVFDLGGRVRRRLAGTRGTLEWDGRDDDGRPVTPGVYLATVATPAGARTVRLLRLR